MASLQEYQGKGRDADKIFYRFQPYIHGRRVTIRVGTGRKGERDHPHVKELIEAAEVGTEPNAKSRRWLATNCVENLARQLLNAGVIAAMPDRFIESVLDEPALSIEGLTDRYIRQIGADKEPATITAYKQAQGTLLEHFGDVAVESITYDNARDYWSWLITDRSLAPNTAKQRLRYARSFFELAIEDGAVLKNPFKAKGLSVTQTAAVKTYVKPEAIETIIQHCPTLEWKLLFSMVRAIPMRIPSEIRELAWSDVDVEHNRILIHSPKTRHIGKHARLVPIFDRLKPVLSQAYHDADDGAVYVFPNLRRITNVAKVAGDIVTKAKIAKWGCFFNSIRASVETDLMDEYGLRRACQWAGNSPATAMKNYALIRNEDFLDAGNGPAIGEKVDAKSDAINPFDAKSDAESQSPSEHGKHRTTKNAAPLVFSDAAIGQAGLEPATKGL